MGIGPRVVLAFSLACCYIDQDPFLRYHEHRIRMSVLQHIMGLAAIHAARRALACLL